MTRRFTRKAPGSGPQENKTGRFGWRLVGKAILFLFVLGIISIAGVFVYFSKDLPSPGKVNKRFIAESTKIYDRTGTRLLYEVHGEEKRTLIPFADMPEVVRAATLTLEDQDFYDHHGVKVTSIIRAVLKDAQVAVFGKGLSQGGSTITQQFVKNSLLTNEKTLTRKIKELILSLEMEQKFSKDEILEMYLNEIPYGSNAYGIEAAAQTFFGKRAKDLGLDEAALLAALPQAPSYYSPYGSHLDALKGRQEFALRKMAELGYITSEQAEEAKNADVFQKLVPRREAIAAPHFVMYVKDYLESKYGAQAVEQGGLKVTTTLDWNLQQAAEEAVRDGAAKNVRLNARNAALVAIDPKTGNILAMVGSKDYFDTKIDGQVNVAIRDRQPGSSFKPYVYLTAFTKGYLPETVVYDVETNFSTDDGKDYKPQNYNGKFNGPVSLAKALGGSLNIPAVKVLYLVGVKDATTLAKNLGIGGLNQPDRYGLSLVLGGGEVKLLDHVNAYATLAAGGVKRPKAAILKIEDGRGGILEEYRNGPGERVVEEKYVAMLDSVLSNNDNRAWVFGDNNPLRFDNRPVAAKTGTTNEFRDAWTVGYTPSVAAGVWVGNNDNSSMSAGADGSVVAAPIWRAFMNKALANAAVEDFPKYRPEDEIGEGDGKTDKPLVSGKLEEAKDIKVCKVPGKDDKYCLANKHCPDDEADKKDFVSAHDILYYVKKDDPRGDIPDKPDRDPQHKQWEKGVKDWYEKETRHTVIDEPPKDECKADDFSRFLPKITLSVPNETGSASLAVKASVDAPHGIKNVTLSVEGSTVFSGDSDNPSVTYSIPPDKNGSNLTVQASVEDDNGNKASDSKTVSVKF
jgi:1A family penicillin-binding protein